MAEPLLSPTEEFANSPLGVVGRRKLRRNPKTGLRSSFAPANTECNRHTYNLMMEHLCRECVRIRRDPTMNVPSVVPAIAGEPLSPAKCWEWLFKSFEAAHADLLAGHEKMRLSLAFGRGRIFAMWEVEQQRFAKHQFAKDTEERQRQYAQERAANGGNVEFFNSNTWQRLRFEVLAESDGRCVLCGRSYREHGVAMEVDHIKPRSRFPNLALDRNNLQVMCFDCNRGKGNRDDTDWRPANHEEEDALAS